MFWSKFLENLKFISATFICVIAVAAVLIGACLGIMWIGNTYGWIGWCIAVAVIIVLLSLLFTFLDDKKPRKIT